MDHRAAMQTAHSRAWVEGMAIMATTQSSCCRRSMGQRCLNSAKTWLAHSSLSGDHQARHWLEEGLGLAVGGEARGEGTMRNDASMTATATATLTITVGGVVAQRMIMMRANGEATIRLGYQASAWAWSSQIPQPFPELV